MEAAAELCFSMKDLLFSEVYLDDSDLLIINSMLLVYLSSFYNKSEGLS